MTFSRKVQLEKEEQANKARRALQARSASPNIKSRQLKLMNEKLYSKIRAPINQTVNFAYFLIYKISNLA